MEWKNTWVWDVETFVNCFTLVAREVNTKTYKRFVIHDDSVNEYQDWDDIKEFLRTKPTLIGYNSLRFDGQISELIYRTEKKLSAAEIYAFAQKCIEAERFGLTFAEWDFSHKHIDLMALNHYDNFARATSLKWLEFTLRFSKMADMPLTHDKPVTKSKVSTLVAYNRNDVDVTHEFFLRCESMIELRIELANKYKERRIINMSDSSIGSHIFKDILTKKNNPGVKKKTGTARGKVKIADCLVDYIDFEQPEFRKVHDNYKNMVVDVRQGLKGIFKEKTTYDGIEFAFGMGGLHGAYDPGVYEPDDRHIIFSIDVASYYPWLAIANGFFPEHLGKEFCQIYEYVYNERKKYPKGDAWNYALKIALNSVYGKSNSEYSFLRDAMYTLKITINGQLLLAMLAERLSNIGRLLLVNTDGIEIKIRKQDEDFLRQICKDWEETTGLMLEYNTYKKLVIKDVNNYIAVDEKDGVKRKGMFEIYSDYTEEGGKPHSYHKNPSAAIVPLALNNYYVHGTPVEETVMGCDNIHEFLFGIKTKKNFQYWFISSDDRGVIEIEKHSARAIRYFISKKGASIFKFFKDGRDNNISSVNKGELVELAMNLPEKKLHPDNYINLDKSYYIVEAEKIMNEIENKVKNTTHGEIDDDDE